MRATSSIVLGCSVELLPKGVFFAFGDRDDPPRLAVLVAEHLCKEMPAESEAAKLSRKSLEPKIAWPDRLRHLADALADASTHSQSPFAMLWDIDALVPAEADSWQDDRLQYLRRTLLRVVLDAARQGGWLLVRSKPSKAGSETLGDLDLETVSTEAASGPTEAIIGSFAPECRPIATWLVQSNVLTQRDLSRVLETVDRFDEHIVQMAYDVLPSAVRDAAKLLSALRPPQPRNGVLGPLRFGETDADETVLPERTVLALEQCGFLQASALPKTERMPRAVRAPMERFVPLGMARKVNRFHERLASGTTAHTSTADELEMHFHAVRAKNIGRAIDTARYYGTELRDLATNLSAADKRFTEAAGIFRHIVTHLDPKDAYSWEYLGYNLARSDFEGNKGTVLDSYRTAHNLWPGNPLYHGRLLGVRGQLHQNVAGDIIKGIDRYTIEYPGDSDALSFFVDTALKGLKRGGELGQIKGVMLARRTVLERFAPLAVQQGAAE